MKILVLNYEYPPLGGGASPVSKEIAERMALLGHQVEVVTMGFKTLPSKESINGVLVHRMNCLRSKINLCHPHEQLSYLYTARKYLTRYLKTNKFDVCHCHALIPTGILASWVKKRFNIPYIVTIHGSDVPGYNPDRFKMLHLFTSGMLKQIIRNAAGITSTSKYLATLLTSKFEVHKISIIPNGVEKNKNVIVDKKDIILSTGRLLKRKGFLTLIKAVKNIESSFELHVFGDGPELSALQTEATDSKMTINFHGWVDNQSALYKNMVARAKIFSLVSTNENASVSILEAMSNGCAIITSNTSGCLEMIDGVGICIDPGNVEQLHNSIVQLISDEDKLSQYAELAFQKSLNVYSWDNIVQDYLDKIRGTKSPVL